MTMIPRKPKGPGISPIKKNAENTVNIGVKQSNGIVFDKDPVFIDFRYRNCVKTMMTDNKAIATNALGVMLRISQKMMTNGKVNTAATRLIRYAA